MISAILLLSYAGLQTVTALDNGLGRTPQMGWNSWNHFSCGINETLIMATAKVIANSPLKAAGYEYVNMDDCWAKSRAADGTIQADPVAFPSGITALASYVHSLGLKFGLYSDSGSNTCAGRPGSYKYEAIDAKTYAAWGVDYLKYDNCYDMNIIPEIRYPPMRDALNATGRPIFFSMCEWGVDNPAQWAPKVGNSWRTTGDIQPNWISTMSNLDYNAVLDWAAGPGQWNDPDMLEVGNEGLTYDESVAHFSLWAIMKSPLIIGNDVTNMDADTLAILTNKEVIAVNQDPLGVQAKRILTPLSDLSSSIVTVETCSGKDNQRWTIGADGTVRNTASNSCLIVPGCSQAQSVPLEVAPCDSQKTCPNATQWIYGADTSLKSQLTGQCVTPWSQTGPVALQEPCKTDDGWYEWKRNETTGSLSMAMDNGAFHGGCLTVRDTSLLEVFAGPLQGGSVAVVLFNRSPAQANITAQWKDIGLDPNTKATVRDLWAHQDLGQYEGSFSASVKTHGAVMVRIEPL